MAVLVIGTFSLVWERRWKNRQVATEGDHEAPATPQTSVREKLTTGIATLRANLPLGKQSPRLEPQFRAWTEQALADDSEVLAWLNALSAPAYSAFVNHVAEYADEMGFPLSDLVNGKMTCLPSAAGRAHAVIVHFCRANYQAALAQEDFDGYRLYATYLDSPTSAVGQQFLHQFYAQLVDQQLVAPPTPDFLALNEQERLAQMQEAIHQSAAKPDEFRTALHTVAADRQRTTADVTVANIVQRAMARVSKAKEDPEPAQQTTTKGTTATTSATTSAAKDETTDATTDATEAQTIEETPDKTSKEAVVI